VIDTFFVYSNEEVKKTIWHFSIVNVQILVNAVLHSIAIRTIYMHLLKGITV